ncbi:hypothetical protein CYCD_10360 [Tenuifilaceae bacterium CYCD]|nr:hypothetical protein CYCD_10360 [Tenuifilaceae bacterium CYCD]
MDYELIKELAKKKGLSIKKIGEKIGMTDSGLYTAFINNTLKVDALEKIAEVLEVKPTYFFGESSNERIRGLIKRNVIIDCRYYFMLVIIENIDIIGHSVFELWDKGPKEETSKFWKERTNNLRNNDSEIVFVDKESRLNICIDYLISKPEYIKKYDESVEISARQFSSYITTDDGINYLIDEELVTEHDVIDDAIEAFVNCFRKKPDNFQRILLAKLKAARLINLQNKVL